MGIEEYYMVGDDEHALSRVRLRLLAESHDADLLALSRTRMIVLRNVHLQVDQSELHLRLWSLRLVPARGYQNRADADLSAMAGRPAELLARLSLLRNRIRPSLHTNSASIAFLTFLFRVEQSRS